MGIGYKEVGILDVGSLGLNFISALELALWQQSRVLLGSAFLRGSHTWQAMSRFAEC